MEYPRQEKKQDSPDLLANRERARAFCEKPLLFFPELRRSVSGDNMLLYLGLENDDRFPRYCNPVLLNQPTAVFRRETRLTCMAYWQMLKEHKAIYSDAHSAQISNVKAPTMRQMDLLDSEDVW